MAGVSILDTDMDIDLEYDDPELARMQEQAAQLNSLPDMAVEGEQEIQETNGVEEGEVPSDAPTLTQIYVESPGMRELGPSDMENFARDNFQSENFQGLEWINDHSLKLTYANAEAAAAALDALTATDDDAVPPANPLELRRAKGLLTHANVEFFVRQAVGTDKKQPGAASRSEFFAKNPGYRRDPYERRDNRPRRGGGFSGRAGFSGKPRRGRFADNSARPTSSNGPEFDESLYDDDSATVAARRTSQDSRYSQDLIPDRRREPRRRNVDLIGDRKAGRLRDRSASPLRDGDGDGMYGFDEKVPYRQTARYRSPPPPPNRRSRDENRDYRISMRQELFPGKKPTTALMDLFPSHAAKSKELFPEKTGRRRHDVVDMYSDETTSALGNWDLHKQSAEGSYTPSGRSSRYHQHQNDTDKGDLFSRITGGPGLQLKASQGRLNAPSDDFNIKGAGDDRGFEFRGASKGASQRGGSNGGGDLFANKIKSRGAQRLHEDMY